MSSNPCEFIPSESVNIILAGTKKFWAGTKIIWAGGKTDLSYGKIIFADGKISLAGGKIIFAGQVGKLMLVLVGGTLFC